MDECSGHHSVQNNSSSIRQPYVCPFTGRCNVEFQTTYTPINTIVNQTIRVPPTVVRMRRSGGITVQDCDTYIGRRLTMGGWNLPQSIWANPYKVGKDGDLDQVLSKYRHHVINDQSLMSRLDELSGHRLGCWCRGIKGREKCHGDVLVDLFKYRYGTQI